MADEQADLEQRLADEPQPDTADLESNDSGQAECGEVNEQPMSDDEDSEDEHADQQAARTLPHEGGAHGVVERSDRSRDLSRDLACDPVAT